MSQKLSFLFLLIASLFSNNLYANEDAFHIFLTRHMEKIKSDSKNPSLSPKGQEKAQRLVSLLKDKNITAIYSTDYARTRETATPLAESLGIPVQIYNPRDLVNFATEVKNKKQNALIVGHSNTTPALTYLISGKPQSDIDESDYNHLFEVILDQEVSNNNTTVIDHPYDDEEPISGIKINSDTLHNIDAQYNMLLNGEFVGKASYDIDVSSQQISMIEHTLIEKFDIDATIKSVASLNTLAPVSMIMDGSMGAPVDIKLQWQPDQNKVNGHSLMPRAGHKLQGKIEVDSVLPNGTVERTAALLAVPFMDLNTTQRFRWYDAYNDETKVIELNHQGMETVTVPAGTFHTNKVKFEGGAPSQLFYLSNEPQPKVVKIEVLGLPWVYELTAVK